MSSSQAERFTALFGKPDVLFGLEFNIAVFPFILAASAAASVIISLLTKPDDEQTLKNFYRRIRPWGFWKPVHDKVVREYPAFLPNNAFKRDALNVAVGIVWQLMLTLIPIYLVIRQFKPMLISIAVLVVTSVFLKFNWYDKLETQQTNHDRSAA